MMDDKKQNISVRLNSSDLWKIKEIAKRLNVRESDVFRFAIKATLKKLIPLHDLEVRGSDLVPAFIECGTDLINYFDFDTNQLEKIINGGVEESAKKVKSEDIELLAMSGMKENPIYMKLKYITGKYEENGVIEPYTLIRQHLYDKYVFQKDGAPLLKPE